MAEEEQPDEPEWTEGYRGRAAAVLGAAGFVGRWVARALTVAGARLILVVRDPDSAVEILGRYGVGGEIVQADLTEPEALARLFATYRPVVTFNLVAYGVDPAERDAARASEVNADLVGRLCAAVAGSRDDTWPGQALVHAGSMSEYGPLAGSLPESATCRPVSAYGRTKLAGTERLAREAPALGIRGLTARLFSVYGPGEHTGRLLPALREAAREGTAVKLTSGAQRRDFVHVEDVAEALLRLGLAEAPPGAVVNVATGRSVTVREFAECAARVLRIPSHGLEFGALPTRLDEMAHGEITVARLRQLTGWSPSTKVEAGIEKTIAFLREMGGGAT